MQLRIHCDGGARGNPGPAASAFIVLDDQQKVLYQQGDFLGDTTNNQAEYTAVILALKWLTAQTPNVKQQISVNFYLDSELVVKQLNGLYKVKDRNLLEKYLEVKKLIEVCRLEFVIFNHVPRNQNTIADVLVNQTLDAR